MFVSLQALLSGCEHPASVQAKLAGVQTERVSNREDHSNQLVNANVNVPILKQSRHSSREEFASVSRRNDRAGFGSRKISTKLGAS